MKIFSFDAETNGLWGDPFAIAAIVYQDGIETARFLSRLPESFVTDSWAQGNVLPAIAKVGVTHSSYDQMVRDFTGFYLQHRDGADMICHMGYIVEAHLLREMRRVGGMGDFDGPYPLYDVSGLLQAAGEDPTSVDAYVDKFGLAISMEYGTTHHPLYDCEVAARAYIRLRCNLPPAVP